MTYDFNTPDEHSTPDLTGAYDDTTRALQSSLEALASYFHSVPTEGMSQTKRVSLEMIAPTQFQGLSPGYFTQHNSKNGVTLALEAISGGMLALIAAGIAAILGMVYKLIKWIFGRSEGTEKVATATANKAATVEALSEVETAVEKKLTTPEAKDFLKRTLREIEHDLTSKDLKDPNGEFAVNEVAYGVITGNREVLAIKKVADEVDSVMELSKHGIVLVSGLVAKAHKFEPGRKFTVEEEIQFQAELMRFDSNVGRTLRAAAPSMKVFSKIDPPQTDNADELSHYPQQMVNPNTSWVKDNLPKLDLQTFQNIAQYSDEVADRVSTIIRSRFSYLKSLTLLQAYLLQQKDRPVMKTLQERKEGGSVFNPRGPHLRRITPEVIHESTNFIKVAIWMSGGHDMLVGAVIRKVGAALQTTERFYQRRLESLAAILTSPEAKEDEQVRKEIRAALQEARNQVTANATRYFDKYRKIIDDGIELTTLYSESEIKALDAEVQQNMAALTTRDMDDTPEGSGLLRDK